jgi:hypothetical protein
MTPRLIVIEYSRVRAAAEAALMAMIVAMFFILLATMGASDPVWLVAFALVLGAAILVLGISPLLTKHDIFDNTLTLRRGWNVKAVIPLEAVTSVEEEPTWGRPQRKRDAMDISGVRGPVIVVRTSRPIKVRSALFRSYRTFVFDAVDHEEILARLKALTPANPVRPS